MAGSADTTKFAVVSDLHFTDRIKDNKTDYVEKLTALCEEEGVDAIICAGDLTDNGTNGGSLCCWNYGGKQDQLTPLKEQFVEPLEQHTNVYLCMGNHDTYVPWPYITHPVGNYIKKKHGALRYHFDHGIARFICLNIYPDKKGLAYLKENLSKDKSNILFFHYNLTGSFSDWWTKKEKEAFYNTIKDYPIAGIICGHLHISSTSTWRDITVIQGAGSDIAVCEYGAEGLAVRYV